MYCISDAIHKSYVLHCLLFAGVCRVSESLMSSTTHYVVFLSRKSDALHCIAGVCRVSEILMSSTTHYVVFVSRKSDALHCIVLCVCSSKV